MKRILLTAFSVAACAFAATGANAQSLEELFKGKNLRMVLGAAAGQDYDLWARLIGRHLSRHIPGNPTVIVENMPGGGHLIATNWLYNVAARDGTVWGMVSRNIPSQALLKLPGARFDPTKFNWIGSPETNNRGCFAMERSGIRRAEDLFERELIVGGTGAGSSVSQTPVLLRQLLGMKFKLVEGYSKPQDAVLAMEKGEIDGICQTVQSIRREHAQWFESGQARVLFTLERDPMPEISAPTIYNFTKTEEQRQILDFYSSSIELGRPIMLPPGVPAHRVEALRRAFDATIKDPLFRKEADAMGFDITLRTGEELETLIKRTMETPQAIVEKVAEMTQANRK
jgi:tripartite-type tricarboxylate transporter receptor subunit TctC